MNNVETMAVSKAVASKDVKAARKELEAGEHDVDVTVRVRGTVKVGEDGMKRSTSSLLNQEFLMLVLKYSGMTRNAAAEAVAMVARNYLVNWQGTKNDKVAAKEARQELVAEFDPEGRIAEIFEGIKASIPMTPVKGSVKFVGDVEVVNDVNVEIDDREEEVAV